MEEMPLATSLSPEQQRTSALLAELLGGAISVRYEDFCRLSAGAGALHLSKPIAAHALRELESVLRGILAVPLDAVAPADASLDARLASATKVLVVIGFDDGAVDRAINALPPRMNHKNQIRQILARLGFERDGKVAKLWIGTLGAQKAAHGRSFQERLNVDSQFVTEIQQPFDIVVREVAAALRDRYGALTRRVRDLAKMPDRGHAANLFAAEIPGAGQLQWEFFNSLETGDWLRPLMSAGLLGEPPTFGDGGHSGLSYGAWPAGAYLLRMAGSDHPPTRQGVIGVLRGLADASHPDILRDGLAIIAALPPAEAASVALLAVDWMRRGGETPNSLSAPPLVMRLAEGGEAEAALLVAREVLRLWPEDGKARSHFSRHMYEHYLPGLRGALTACCGPDALALLADCLDQALRAEGHDTLHHLPFHPISHDAMPHQNVVEALAAAVRETALQLLRSGVATIADVVTVLEAKTGRIFARLALHVLAQDPGSAPGIATSRLLNEELSTEEWCGWEYSELAVAWFPSMTPDDRAAVLAAVDGVPGRYVDGWRARFANYEGRPPSSAEVLEFAINCTQELLWRWRSVLPPERRRQVEAKGDPNAWRGPRALRDEVQELRADFSTMPVDEIIRLLDERRVVSDALPADHDGLGRTLRLAAAAKPERFAAAAGQFAEAHPGHLQCLLDGFHEAASEGRMTEWNGVLSLTSSILERSRTGLDAGGDSAAAWSLACEAGGSLLLTGLRPGGAGMPVALGPLVRALIFKAAAIAPKVAVAEGFEESFARHAFFAARRTFKGMVTEACVLLTRHWTVAAQEAGHVPGGCVGQDPEVAALLDHLLLDHGAGGRVPRAIVGRHLRFLQRQDPVWFLSRLSVLFPANAGALSRATWDAHLACDNGPVSIMTPELELCYDEEIAALSSGRSPDPDDDYRQQRLAEYLLVMVLRGDVPSTLLDRFLAVASVNLRRHGMWWLGNQLSDAVLDLPLETRQRGRAYWEQRLAAAAASPDPRVHQAEFGVVDLWCLHGRLDELWLAEQLLNMFKVSLVPDQGYHVMGWLAALSARHPDLAVEVLLGLIRQDHSNRWLFTSFRTEIRSVLVAGVGTAMSDTIRRVGHVVNRLASIGEPGFLDLDPEARSR